MALRSYIRLRSLCTLSKHQGQTIRHGGSAVFVVASRTGSCSQICHRQMSQGFSEPYTCPSSRSAACTISHSLTCTRTISSHICSSHHRQTHFTRHMSGGVVAKFTQNIDLEKLKEEVKREAREKGTQIQLVDRVKELVAQKCAETIANFSEEERKKLRVIQLEHNFLYSEGHDILAPDVMKDEFWVEAMALPSKSQRLKYYLHLSKRLYMKKAEQEKKAAYKQEMQNRPRQEEYEHGRIFMRIYDQTMRKWLSYGLARAMQLGTPLVFDMDYVDQMRPQEQKNTAHQLHDVYCLNRSDEAQDPFHIHFTSCQSTNTILKLMQIKTQDSPFLLSTVTEKSYLDLFEKDRLVYLSPQGRQTMKQFDPEAVYIIGAFNDKATQKPVSYARAMEQGIRCQRLPIDEYLNWNQGTKNLTLDQMMRIMLDVKNKLPWKTAFRAIPQRKLR